MGYADIGVHGCKDIPTPHIDSLAKRGVRFTDAYANGSFCTPTRAALISGRYQHRSGNEDLDGVTGPLPRAVTTLPQRLKAAGYATGMAGKWHLGTTEGFRPTERGFDEFYGILGGGSHNLPGPLPGKKDGSRLMVVRGITPEPATEYLQDAWAREAVRFVEAHRSEPWFFYLAFNAVHTPVQATEKYLQRFAQIEDPKRRVYAAMLSAVDDGVGAVLGKLAETGQLDRTLVVFHNDNGGPTTRNAVNGSRNAPLRGSKCETFEGGIRVPLLMQLPGVIEAGSVYRQPVISMDITATAVALAGADADRSGGRRPGAVCDRQESRFTARGVVLAVPHAEQQLRRSSGRLEVRLLDRRRRAARPEPAARAGHAVQPGRRHRRAARPGRAHPEKLADVEEALRGLERRRGRRLPQARHRAEDERLEPETHREEASKVRIHPSVA